MIRLGLGALALAVIAATKGAVLWSLVAFLWAAEPLVVMLPVCLAGMVVVAIVWPDTPHRCPAPRSAYPEEGDVHRVEIHHHHTVEHRHVVEHHHHVHATVTPIYHGPAALAPAPQVIEGRAAPVRREAVAAALVRDSAPRPETIPDSGAPPTPALPPETPR